MNAPYEIAAHAWLGASIALGGGLGLGLLLALLWWRDKPGGGDTAAGASAQAPWREGIADIDEQMNHCIDQLRELDEQESRFEPQVFAEQKAEFEARAVALMQARDAAAAPKKRTRAARQDDVSSTMRFLAARPQLRGFLWGAGFVGVGAFLYFLVNTEQVAPPQRAATSMAPTQGSGAPPNAPFAGGAAKSGGANPDMEEMKALQQKLTQNHDDVPSLVRMAHLLLKNQIFEQAAEVNGMVLRHEPMNVEGLVHAAVLQAAEGHGEDARADLNRLVKKHADFAEAWFFRGMLAMQGGDQETMKDSFRHFVKVAPPGAQRDRIEAMLKAQGG